MKLPGVFTGKVQGGNSGGQALLRQALSLLFFLFVFYVLYEAVSPLHCNFTLQGTFCNIQKYICLSRLGDATGIYWVEARNGQKHPATSKTALRTKTDPAQNASGAVVEKFQYINKNQWQQRFLFLTAQRFLGFIFLYASGVFLPVSPVVYLRLWHPFSQDKVFTMGSDNP